MQVRIHRGAREVGGSCVEIEHDGARVVVDAGSPLDSPAVDLTDLPDVAGFRASDPTLLALLISHPHPDHYGLISFLGDEPPIYMGAGAARILREAEFFVPQSRPVRVNGNLRSCSPMALGPFTVTPFLMDHSAFDSYVLLIEAGGRRLLYSGDLRAHGRRRGRFEAFVSSPPRGINTLLLEGTHVRSTPASSVELTEDEVETHAIDLIYKTEGLVMACFSPQNVDRLVSLYRAARRSGRTFVMDLYTASIASATGRPGTIPQADWPGVRVFVPNAQRIAVKRSEEFWRVNLIRSPRIFIEEIANSPSQYVMLFRGSMQREVEKAVPLDNAALLWSMWTGYLDRPDGQVLTTWLRERDVALHLVHASGHARVQDLQRFAAAVNADSVVPIHTTAPRLFPQLFENVTTRQDGEWWPV